MGTESISMKAKCRKMWDISKHMLKELGRFSEKTIAGKIMKIERTSAESGLYLNSQACRS